MRTHKRLMRQVKWRGRGERWELGAAAGAGRGRAFTAFGRQPNCVRA